MKRPRRPAKKTARKAVRKPVKKVAARAKRIWPPQRKADPFWFAPHLIPVGWGYAWKINHVDAMPPGWGLVPFSRHAHDFPRSYNVSGFIVHGGLILCEALADQIESEQWTLMQAARDQVSTLEQLRRDNRPKSEGYFHTYIMPESWVETAALHEAPVEDGPPVEIAVTLVVRVPVRWRNAADYLKIQFSEYVRRRLQMDRHVLGVMDPFDGYDPVYEPITLKFSPSKEV